MTRLLPDRAARRPRALARFLRDRRGVAATEFALIIPVMLVLYIGTVEVTEAVYTDRRVTLVARVAGDLIGRDPMTGSTLADFAQKGSRGINALAPVNASRLELRVTAYGVDDGGPSDAPRAFVDWQVTCTVAAYTGSAVPNMTCVNGSTSSNFSAGRKRCEIDDGISVDVLKPGTQLIRVESFFQHRPILSKLFQPGNNVGGMLGFMPATGFPLLRTYYTWPRSNARVEGPPGMTTKNGVSNDQSLPPSSASVCASNAIPASERFKT